MPQQFLYGADVSTSFQKVGRKTVAEHVGAHHSEASPASYLSYDMAERASG